MLVNCDKCYKDFKIVKLDEYNMFKEIQQNIIEVSYRCQYCNHKHVMFYTSNKVKKMQSEIRALQTAVANELKTLEIRVLNARIDKRLKTFGDKDAKKES